MPEGLFGLAVESLVEFPPAYVIDLGLMHKLRSRPAFIGVRRQHHLKSAHEGLDGVVTITIFAIQTLPGQARPSRGIEAVVREAGDARRIVYGRFA